MTMMPCSEQCAALCRSPEHPKPLRRRRFLQLFLCSSFERERERERGEEKPSRGVRVRAGLRCEVEKKAEQASEAEHH